jgi:peptidoglycan/xylan/chitin deacetylase (PgdA/CDA1 family)
VKITLLFSLLIFATSAYGQNRQVCFSFDDLPVVGYGITDTTFQKQVTDRLVGSLAKNRIPAIGFVNEKKMYEAGRVSQFQTGLLKSWLDNRLELGNHTYSHPDYNTVSYREFTEDLLKGETLTRKLLMEKGKTLKYFRHPFLHVGPTRAKADSLDAFLASHGYTTAPVTIDNEDYLFALAYHRANNKKDTALMKRIGTDFLLYMEAKMKYYEKQSVALFGREIPQILLLHASLLNADYTDALAAIFRKNNYSFISMDKVLEDVAYQTEVTVYGKWGISWIDKWALSLGKKGDFFKEEPLTPEYINKLSAQ